MFYLLLSWIPAGFRPVTSLRLRQVSSPGHTGYKRVKQTGILLFSLVQRWRLRDTGGGSRELTSLWAGTQRGCTSGIQLVWGQIWRRWGRETEGQRTDLRPAERTHSCLQSCCWSLNTQIRGSDPELGHNTEFIINIREFKDVIKVFIKILLIFITENIIII